MNREGYICVEMTISEQDDGARDRRRLVAIVGPTAVGKTGLAIRLAALVGGEIVSADSRQVYRYMDIGTGKPTCAERVGVRHHLIDLVAPNESFDAADFCRLGRAAIDEVSGRGRPVVVCGGSGLYVKALLHGLFPGPKAEPALRRRLVAEAEAGGGEALHRRLAACDADTAARLHPNDVTRVIRALEVVRLTGRPISEWHRLHAGEPWPHSVLTIALWSERDLLRERIATRCHAMVAAGLAEEVSSLWKCGYGPELRPLRTLGYRHMGEYIAGEKTKDEALAEMVRDTRRFAKRQMTWFRAHGNCRWFNVEREAEAAVVAAQHFLDGRDV